MIPKYPANRKVEDVVAYVTGDFKQRAIKPESMIIESWQRCYSDYQLNPDSENERVVLTSHELNNHQQLMGDYFKIAVDGVNSFGRALNQAGLAVLLADSQGVTVAKQLPTAGIELFESRGFVLGSCWNEKISGTNAIGMSLIEKQPLIVHGQEHYNRNSGQLSCSVAPIFDSLGNFMGCLNASCLSASGGKETQFLTLKLVTMYARMIENSYFYHFHRNNIIVAIKSTNNFGEEGQECLIAFSERGNIIGANRNSFAQYAMLFSGELIGKKVEVLLNLSIEQLQSSTNGGLTDSLITIGDSEEQFKLQINFPMRLLSKSNHSVKAKSETKKTHHGHPSLAQLQGNDQGVVSSISRIKKIINQDIPILLQGETGTGKEAFARAIHDESDRANGPFIALNCAAIPESLIESELFGYQNGTFTGARKNGMKGKLSQANGGTIFLDEIGDMPIQLQTRLLRTLAEKEVLPLGAEVPEILDVKVISATHQNLQEQIKNKAFREDFFYRLNGMSLKLPPLRERSDKDDVITSVLKSENTSFDDVQFERQAYQFLLDYSWPGNIRQLKNVLKYALAIKEGSTITINDFPDDIINGCSIINPVPANDDNQSSSTVSCNDQDANILLNSLRLHKWNVTGVAEELGICRSTIYRKMKKFNIVQPNDIF
ncbi:sigma-54-dependent Fis family transcriptional regulator [Colwellia sp. 6_MG-2023]|uniref:sigma-54-dependent Fis family transcriptional regulator n=1 Tax=Colwellia sp. 6_MG-2023 TaxID=3062676 RepID=UPI0026E1BB74|nr:sigma-54-dependent Fis family transcriptional regulator [Colwellia sp. 6_MG-2023]MDO6486598.1 sigma-54-dependent Fis family transcriptional regulator [Colwellia sp. 6_MG-2023]